MVDLDADEEPKTTVHTVKTANRFKYIDRAFHVETVVKKEKRTQ